MAQHEVPTNRTSLPLLPSNFLATAIGGSFAIYLFYRSNKEKRMAFISSIYDRLYSDIDIKAVIYVTDKKERVVEA